MTRIDPRHGGEVVDLIDLATGRQVMGRPPFSSDVPRGGDLDEETWTRSYRGGWQMLTPNAGNACIVEGIQHGFHGRASNDAWRVVSVGDSSTTLVWSGHGMTVTRCYEVTDSLRVSVTMKSVGKRVPVVVVEHIALGNELLDPAAVIDLAGGHATELPTEPGSAMISGGTVQWPQARLLDGTITRVDRVAIDVARSLLVGVANLQAGRVSVTNEAKAFGITIRWDFDPLKHLWMWQEIRTSAGPWRKAGELLIIEPSSVPHHFGLAEAIGQEECLWLNPGESWRYSIGITFKDKQ
ncbi:MAG TPA: hypothetical protein VFE58_06760 [Tepidisphaeraceae bacterium]|nr:hypothetical protein [Tepidisphaeraceae bacterium]